MRAIAAAVVLGVLFGCTKEKEASTAPSADVAAASQPTREVSSSFIGESWDATLPEQAGETITLEGEFFGGDRDRVCKYGAATRTSGIRAPDWALRKDGRCIWVSGALKMFGDPEETLKAEHVGRRVEVTAKVVTDGDGRILLEATDAKALD